jgi:CMP-N,N'-diacetyllegionaminic acid synthase
MNKNNLSCIALIPARSGSERIPQKNIRIFNNHPLIAYSIKSALDSGIFLKIIVSTDSEEIATISRYYGADTPFLRPKIYATPTSPDVEWVKYTLNRLNKNKIISDCYAIIRPTSPFRTGNTIRRAWQRFQEEYSVDSLRAVEKCRQHPAKMWKIRGNRMMPLVKNPEKEAVPWHSTPYQALPKIYSQNASIEIAWSKLPLEKSSISGTKIIPFLTENYEGYDINDEKDWIYAEYLVKQNKGLLPTIGKNAYKK